MSASTIVTDMELDDEVVALVRLPPSPTIEPTTPSNLSTLTSISSSNSTILDPNIATTNPVDAPETNKITVDSPNDRVSTAIPTPVMVVSDGHIHSVPVYLLQSTFPQSINSIVNVVKKLAVQLLVLPTIAYEGLIL